MLSPASCLTEGDRLASVVHFFLYDAIKILALIFLVVSFIAFLRTFVKPSALKKRLAKLPFGVGNLFASLFGAVTPFCSCSSIPLFIGFACGIILTITLTVFLKSGGDEGDDSWES